MLDEYAVQRLGVFVRESTSDPLYHITTGQILPGLRPEWRCLPGRATFKVEPYAGDRLMVKSTGESN